MNLFKNIIDISKKYNSILTRNHKRWGCFILVLSIIGAAFETLGVSVILPLVQGIMDIDMIYHIMPVEMSLYVRNNFSDNDIIWFLGLGVIFVYIIKNGFLLLLSYARARFACKVKRELTLEMIDSYLSRGYIYFQNVSVGQYLRGMGYSVTMAYDGLYHILRLISELLATAFICVYILLSDPVMALGVVVIISLCLLLIFLICRKLATWSGQITYKYDAIVHGTKLSIYHGIKEILVMGRGNFFTNRLQHSLLEQQKGDVCKTVVIESPAYLIEASCVLAMIIFICVRAVTGSDMTHMIPQLATFAVAAFRILPSLGRISSSFNNFIVCTKGIDETYNVINDARSLKKEAIIEKSITNSRDDIKNAQNLGLPLKWDNILLRNIVWSYDASIGNVIDGINLDIGRGDSIALVGSSGSGKTTLGDIILGLLHPQQGQVSIDNVDIRTYEGQLGCMFGFVPQMVYLLNDSIKNNIAYGVPIEQIDDAKLNRALQQAQLSEFVNSLPLGVDTVIGESGTKLSGGQRQRIAIARALYEDPDVLILDEATSALDTETEKAVMDAIDTLHGKKTLIIIAHRLTTIKKCNRIYRVSNGKLEQCKYSDLV